MYDLEALWSDLKTSKMRWHRQAAVYALQDAFGGYCHVGRARHSAFGSGATRNPWRAGGCVPQAPPVTATSDTSIVWAAPRYDGGSPITKYLVEWKGPGEEFDPSRSLEVTDLSSLSYRSEDLAPGSSVRVTAYNHNGWGEPSTVTTDAQPYGSFWAGYLDVGDSGRGILGFTRSDSAGYGALSPREFTDGQVDHTIDYIILPSPRRLILGLSPEISSNFVLYVGDQPFQKSDATATRTTGEHRYMYMWDNPGLSWQAGDRVAVRLAKLNTGATGAPAISGSAVVGQTLTAGIGDIVDPDGLPGSEEFSYQWVRIDGGGESDIAGATSPSYTVAAADAGLHIKVRVGYRDNSRFPESLASSSVGPVTFQQVPDGWPLIPAGLGSGDSFRLLFVTSTMRNAASADIGDYDSFVRDAAVGGHSAIARFSSQFRALASTPLVDARDHTDTTGTGVAVYWLNGEKLADNYDDLYDGDWASQNPTLESGEALTGADAEFEIWTGTAPNGQGATLADHALLAESAALGAENTLNSVRIGLSSLSGGELANSFSGQDGQRSLYGLSPVFVVQPSSDATLASLVLSDGTLNPVSTRSTADYTAWVPNSVSQIAVMAEATDADHATVEFLDADDAMITDADDQTEALDVALEVGENTIRVKVTAEDGTTIEIYVLIVTRDELNATGAPVITGTPRVGEALTADVSAIDDVNGAPPVSEFRFQWIVVDGGADIVIAGATSPTYYPSASQMGKAIKVRASFTDDVGNDEGPLVSEPSDAVAPVATTEVPEDWPLVPPGLSNGDSFRLLFITDARRNARSSDINAYNDWIQNQVVAGHTDIRDYSAGFRVVGSTNDVDARDNTGTTFTAAHPGVPIYWLNGPKAVDHYEDFYDGDWDDEVNQRDEFGDPREIAEVWTGSDHDGTESFNDSSRTSRALGNSQNHWVRFGSPAGNRGPLSGPTLDRRQNRRMYGLSGVFTVAPLTLVANSSQTATTASLPPVTAVLPGDADTRNVVRQAQEFTTGPRYAGYFLTSIVIAAAGDDTDVRWAASIHSGNAGVPGAKVADLFSISSDAADEVEFTAPSAISLAANTNYFVVLKASRGGANVEVVHVSPSDGEDPGAAAGWSIGDNRLSRVGTQAWETAVDALILTVKGSVAQATPPLMPTGLTATAGNERAVLAWTDRDGGSPVTRHQYRYSTDGGGSWGRWTNIPMTAPLEMKAAGYTLTGLTNGTSYTFEVRAVNAEGESPASNEATVTPCVCDATLTSLELSGTTLSPVFASGTTSYVALVENSVTQVAVTAAAAVGGPPATRANNLTRTYS